jgi:hypothetical protein
MDYFAPLRPQNLENWGYIKSNYLKQTKNAS